MNKKQIYIDYGELKAITDIIKIIRDKGEGHFMEVCRKICIDDADIHTHNFKHLEQQIKKLESPLYRTLNGEEE